MNNKSRKANARPYLDSEIVERPPVYDSSLMDIGDLLVVKCYGKDAEDLKKRKLRLVEKYRFHGIFQDRFGKRVSMTWWEVGKIGRKDTTYNENGIPNYIA